MYIFEIIIKKIKNFRKKNKISYMPSSVNRDEEAYKDCENHIYLPIDSSKEYLACKNCGHIIKKRV